MAAKREGLTAEQFLERSKSDRSFYFEEAVRIRPKTGIAVIPLAMRPAQVRLMEKIDAARAAGRRPQVVILKARQIGFSTVTGAELFRQCHLYALQQALIVAHKTESVEVLFANVDRIYEHLPEPVKPKKRYSTKRLIHFESNDSRLEVAIAKDARGFTANILHISELAFIDKAGEFMTGVLETCPDDPSSLIVVESTPNGIGNEFHDMWVKASRPGGNRWIPFFVPWFDEPTYQMPTTLTLEELNARTDDSGLRAAEIVRVHKVSVEQIAWWLDHLENTCGGDLDRMEQEMASDPRTCFLASGRHVFERKGLEHYISMAGIDPDSDSALDPAKVDARDSDAEENLIDRSKPNIIIRRGGPLRVYRPPYPRHQFVLGADISAGDPGSDPSPLVIINRHTMDVDAVWYGRLAPELLAKKAQVLGYWYNSAKIVGEANNQGLLFNHTLVNDLYPNIYFRRSNERSVAGKVTPQPGFWTSGENRHLLFGLVRRYVREMIGRIEDDRLVWEFTQLRFEEDTDRIDHQEHSYSDGTIAFAMALAVHAGSFDAQMSPLSLDDQERVVGLRDEMRMRAGVGLPVDEIKASIDIFGMTVDDVDRLYEDIEKRAERVLRTGRGGER